MTEDSKMIRVGGHGASVGTGRLWRIALLTLAGAISTACEADAAVYYWPGYDHGYYYLPAPTVPQRPRVRRPQTKTIEAPEKESSKPQGPLIIAISIDKQSLKIYDANGFFAETPISTGMRGHPTPMGVFSIIQKHKFHHSNIYSNAPMPYMQRITWSGVAMHAGVLPGYPASHGCIRMPMAFAIKMWNWTRMGARVVVTPGEMMPASFAHPLLPTERVAPQPVAAAEPESGAASPAASLELRSTVGHPDGVKAAADEATPGLRDPTRTADASGNTASSKATMSDAFSGRSASQPEDNAAKSESKSAGKPESISQDSAGRQTTSDAKAGDAVTHDDKVTAESKTAAATTVADAKPANAKPEPAKVDAAKPAEPAKAASAADVKANQDPARVADRPVETKAVETKAVETKPVETKPVETKPVETKPVETKPVETKAAATKADPP